MRQLCRTLVVFAAATDCVFAARPLVTDDAHIVDPHACQLESYVKKLQDSTEYWALPACNPFENLELTIGGNWIRNDDSPNSNHLILQGKTIFRPVEVNGWGVGLAVGIVKATSPAATRGTTDLYANVPITFSLRDDTVLVHVNAGVDRDRVNDETKFTYGLASEIAINPRFSLLAETYGDSRENPFWQGGVRIWIVPERWQVDSTIGGQFGVGHSGVWFTVGIRLLSEKLF
jgi:hypothetical protein